MDRRLLEVGANGDWDLDAPECPECGVLAYPNVNHERHGSPGDGLVAVTVTTAECPACGYCVEYR